MMKPGLLATLRISLLYILTIAPRFLKESLTGCSLRMHCDGPHACQYIDR